MTEQILTQEVLKEYLYYNYVTDNFAWRKDLGAMKEGDIAGHLNARGYVIITLFYKNYRAHRLAWLYCYGYLPELHIDHIDGVKNNNALLNLRLATNSENHQNLTILKTNSSGHVGVHFHKLTSKWQATITINKKRKYLGLFENADEAGQAYIEAKRKHHTFNPELRKS